MITTAQESAYGRAMLKQCRAEGHSKSRFRLKDGKPTTRVQDIVDLLKSRGPMKSPEIASRLDIKPTLLTFSLGYAYRTGRIDRKGQRGAYVYEAGQ